ncbi:MAG: hypothetical protein NVSMB46_04690 [Candidatus Saccharimonadales bacterium]
MCKKIFIIVAFAITSSVAQLVLPANVFAQQASSPNYRVNEVQFGTGGNNGTSASYQAQSSVGSLGSGSSSSTKFTSKNGFLTQNEEYLEINVISGSVDLGTLSTSSTSYGSGSFYVRSYTSSGYSVISLSQPPTNPSGNILKKKAVLGAPIAGTEEYGINVVSNPNVCGASCNVGADPVAVPSTAFANGAAAAGYNTSGQFKYNPGDTIASASNGNGQTNYTVSVEASITGVTPAGAYTTNQDLLVVTSY